ncbi:LysR family transcriptional regulator [Nocardioides euryhalodurans]|uniref:LysR family transcriptional regulator n=1 Tax=Nocardioides euryhalodurans TaxID=2518370 RepID=A0A4P7GPQ6_9ACTN|nr:LysR family transcriptional regulator [Nocardioides euryhalodurans]QBR93787.1 LysR family transcriptional regulator [Nocardioides euryhalodurans]
MSINIGVRHLRAVVAVADAGGYTAAAGQLRVAQSSLSRTVLEAERRLGVQLFERTTRRVAPTADGVELVRAARRLLAEFDATLANFEGYLSGERGTIVVAALPSVAATLLPAALAAFRGPRPEVSVSVRDGLSGEVLEMVRTGAVDLALTVASQDTEDLLVRRVATDTFACVFPEGHQLAEQDTVRWADLAGRPFVSFDTTSSIRDHADRTLRERGVSVGPQTEARNIAAVAGLTAAGLGVTAAPGLVLPLMQFAGLLSRPLVDPVVRRDICVVQHPERPVSRTAGELVQLLLHASDREVELPDLVSWAQPNRGPGAAAPDA